MHAVGLVLEPIDLDGMSQQPFVLFQRPEREANLFGGCGDDVRQLARAESDGVQAVQTDHRRRRVNRVHHVVERTRQRVDVFAIDGRDKRAVEALNQLVREEVALVLDFLDLFGLVPDRRLAGEHLLQETSALLQLVGHRQEVAVELFFAGEKAEGHETGIVADPSGLRNSPVRGPRSFSAPAAPA